jgi:hypothetical protein
LSKIKVTCNFCKKRVIKNAAIVKYQQKRNKPFYCGYSCSNKSRTEVIITICQWCKKSYSPKWNKASSTFCSIKCGSLYSSHQRHVKYIERWKLGLENGNTSKNGVMVSSHIRKYLFKKYKSKCSECGWHKIHPITRRIPLEIDHLDGNWKNNCESNLRLICPNCHSLSPNFRALNKGRGRKNN